jgi:hypothetical protein
MGSVMGMSLMRARSRRDTKRFATKRLTTTPVRLPRMIFSDISLSFNSIFRIA